jgi:hypothetical protein
MEPLYLQSEEALFGYLKKFLKDKPKALQLDGSVELCANSKVAVVFSYSIDGQKYKLLGETTRRSIEIFVHLTEENGDAGVALKISTSKKHPGLVLADGTERRGWMCLPYLDKTSDKLKKVA